MKRNTSVLRLLLPLPRSVTAAPYRPWSGLGEATLQSFQKSIVLKMQRPRPLRKLGNDSATENRNKGISAAQRSIEGAQGAAPEKASSWRAAARRRTP